MPSGVYDRAKVKNLPALTHRNCDDWDRFTDRNKYFYALSLKGYTCPTIGEAHDLTSGRIRQIVKREILRNIKTP